MGTFIETQVPYEVISSSCNALVVPFQQLLEAPREALLCERVNDLRHSLSHLLNCFITTVWTIGRVRNCLDAHFGQIVRDKDRVMDWCIVLVEILLTRFEECWPLLTESLAELP